MKMLARIILGLAAGAILFVTVHGGNPMCYCSRTTDSGTGAVNLHVDIRSSDPVVKELRTLDQNPLTTISGCNSSLQTLPDNTEVQTMTIVGVVVYDGNDLITTFTQTTPQLPEDCYSIVDQGKVYYTFVAARQVGMIQWPVDTYWKCGCDLTADPEWLDAFVYLESSIEPTPIDPIAATVFEMYNAADELIIPGSTVNIGLDVYFRYTLSLPAAYDPGTYPIGAQLTLFVVYFSSDFSDPYYIHTSDGCTAQTDENAAYQLNPFHFLRRTGNQFVTQSEVTAIAAKAYSAELYFVIEFFADCFWVEDRCDNQTAHCTTLAGSGRRRRAADEMGNKTLEFRIAFGNGGGSALGDDDKTPGSSAVSETASRFWIASVVLAALLFLAVLSVAFLFFRLKGEQKKSWKMGQAHGHHNPAF